MDNAKTADSVSLADSGTLGADVAAVIDSMAEDRPDMAAPRRAIYDRLQYVRRERIVIDPVTGTRTPAGFLYVLGMIDVIAKRETARADT